MPITSIDQFGIIEREKDYQNLLSLSSPNWVKSAIIYEVYLRSYSKDGTINSFVKKLPELKEFGIDIIWLMPIHIIGHVKRKGPLGSPYAIRDFFRINNEYGTKEDFKELVNETHRQGMRVMLDFVVNHAANDHIEVKNHPEWFKQDDAGNFTREIPGWSDVIDFNYANKELREYIKKIALFWVKEFDIDGYRCDVAGMVPEDFWIDLRKSLLKVKSDFLMLAEWEDPEMHLKTFDITYDWVLYYKLYDVYNGTSEAHELADLVLNRQKAFPKNALRLRFLENHDQARVTYKFGLNSFRPFTALIFLIDGVPLIYNGQESGDPKHLTLFDKNSINWKIRGAFEIKKFYKSLIDIRKTNPVFTEGETIKIANNKENQILSIGRKLAAQEAVIVFNMKDEACTVQLQAELNKQQWDVFDIHTMEMQHVTLNNWNINIKAYGGLIFISH